MLHHKIYELNLLIIICRVIKFIIKHSKLKVDLTFRIYKQCIAIENYTILEIYERVHGHLVKASTLGMCHAEHHRFKLRPQSDVCYQCYFTLYCISSLACSVNKHRTSAWGDRQNNSFLHKKNMYHSEHYHSPEAKYHEYHEFYITIWCKSELPYQIFKG